MLQVEHHFLVCLICFHQSTLGVEQKLVQSSFELFVFCCPLQVFNKLLSLASTASSQKYQSQMWSQMLLSTHAFLKSISNVSGKDIGPLIKQWVYPFISNGLWLFLNRLNCMTFHIQEQHCLHKSGQNKAVGMVVFFYTALLLNSLISCVSFLRNKTTCMN